MMTDKVKLPNWYDSWIYRTQTFGTRVAPRGEATNELLAVSLSLGSGSTYTRNRINAPLGYVEGLCVVAGYKDMGALSHVAPKVVHQGYFNRSDTSYGERIRSSLYNAISLLKEDPNTRRAAMYVGNAMDYPDERPCTQSVQLLIRDDALHIFVNMRSWDIILGLPYDIIMWQVFGFLIRQVLGLPAHALHFYASSLHIYSYHQGVEWNADCGPMLCFDEPGVVDLRTAQEYAVIALSDVRKWVPGAGERASISWQSTPPGFTAEWPKERDE